jgi:hypothetical protein
MRMRTLFLAVCAWVLGGAAYAQTPDWLAGAWLMCGRGQEISETWVGEGSGVLVGVGLTRGANGRVSFEHMRIAPNAAGVVSFYGSPDGAAATEFPSVSQGERRIVFENLAHDFPQRVIYAREGRTLTARVEDAAGENGMQWRYRRARLGARC